MVVHPQDRQGFGDKRAPLENDIAIQQAQSEMDKANGSTTPITGPQPSSSSATPIPKAIKPTTNPKLHWLNDNKKTSRGYNISAAPYSTTPTKQISLKSNRRYITPVANQDTSVTKQDIYGINQVPVDIQPEYLKPAPINYFEKAKQL